MASKATPPEQPKKPGAAKKAAKPATPKKGSTPAGAVPTPAPKRMPKPKGPPPKTGKNPFAKGAGELDRTREAARAKQQVGSLVEEATRAVGRPTKYSDDFIPQMIAFFNIEVERDEAVPLRDNKGNVLCGPDGAPIMETIKVVNRFPTLERFAANIGVSSSTLRLWASEKDKAGEILRPEFSAAYARARDLQAALLQEGGMSSTYQPHMTIFGLKNLAGWKDSIEQTIEANVTTTTKDALDALYKQGMEDALAGKAQAQGRELAGTVPGAGQQ